MEVFLLSGDLSEINCSRGTTWEQYITCLLPSAFLLFLAHLQSITLMKEACCLTLLANVLLLYGRGVPWPCENPHSPIPSFNTGPEATASILIQWSVFLFQGLLFRVFLVGVLGFGPTQVVLAYTLPPACRCIVKFQQICLRMKAHSSVWENVPRLLNSAKGKSSTVPVPTAHQYAYFVFAPTVTYRDKYPRTPTIRWGFCYAVCTDFWLFILCVLHLQKALCPLYEEYQTGSLRCTCSGPMCF